MERLDKTHRIVIQAIRRTVLRVLVVVWVDRRLQVRLYMQNTYRVVIKPHEIPDTKVTAVRETLAA